MKLLVKLGGALLDTAGSRQSLCAQIASAVQAGHEVVVVHGGGKQMTRFLAERGVESKFVDGLRVTTPDVIDAVLKVFAGSVNHELVASLVAQGVDAVGLSGVDAALVEAEQLRPDLGAVGRPTRCRGDLFQVLLGGGFTPVVACVAGNRDGMIFNVNADQMAVACAIGFQADRLLFLTDVDGVRGAAGAPLPELTLVEGEELIRSGVATGGMQAKLNAAGEALRRAVPEVWIAAGTTPGVLPRLLAGEHLGTRFISQREGPTHDS